VVEWSRRPWSAYNKSVQVLSATCPGGGILSGSLRLLHNTSVFNAPASLQLPEEVRTGFPVAAVHVSSDFRMDSSAWDARTILMNMPNVGDVSVNAELNNGSAANWTITFESEVGAVPVFQIYSTDLRCDCRQWQQPCTELDPVADVLNLPGAIPLDAKYRFTEVEVASDAGSSFAHTLPELTPGEPYYARVAAHHRLGYGLRRDAAPSGLGSNPDGSVSVPYLAPDPPLNPWYAGGAPTLHVLSETALSVSCGLGAYDGGSEPTKFMVQWDTSPNFNSGANESPLGVATPDATLELCSSCVTSFDLLAQTLTIDGTDLLGALYTDATILVNRKWLFRLASEPAPSFVNLTVVAGHAVFDDFAGAFSLHLVGALHHPIRHLEPGTPYYVRCFALNAEVGWSRPSHTEPQFEVPRAAPHPPASLSAAVMDATTVEFAWPPASVQGDRVSSYLLDLYTATPRTAIASGAVFGVQEVQTITTTGAPGGTFTLSFGNVDEPLPGTVGVVHGGTFLLTTQDLTQHVRRGDRIVVDDVTATDPVVYLVHAYDPFNATHLPLAPYTESVIPYRLGTASFATRTGYEGVTNERAKVYRAPTTQALTYDASHLEVEAALESLPSISTVHVTRDASGNDPGDGGVEGFVWSITFTGPTVLSALHTSTTSANGGIASLSMGPSAAAVAPGDQPLLVPNGRHLTNTNTTQARLEAYEVRAGVSPSDYRAVVVSAADFAGNLLY
jgi:hypothetical protein